MDLQLAILRLTPGLALHLLWRLGELHHLQGGPLDLLEGLLLEELLSDRLEGLQLDRLEGLRRLLLDRLSRLWRLSLQASMHQPWEVLLLSHLLLVGWQLCHLGPL